MHNKKAYLWGLITKIGPAAIQLISNMILARFLTPEDFGVVGVLAIIFVVANVLVDSGLGGSLVKEKVISPIDCSTIFGFNLIVSVLLYLILFFISPLVELFYDINNLAYINRLLSLTFVIGAIGLVPRALLMKDLKFGIICIITMIATIIATIIAIIMAYMNYGVYSLVAYQLINALISSILLIVTTNYKYYWGFSFNSLKRLIPFGIYTSIISVIDTIYENLLASLTGKYLSVMQAGYLTQAKKVEEGLSSSISASIGSVSFPILTKLKDNIQTFQEEAWSLLRFIILITFPVLLTISVFANTVVVLLFGNAWSSSAFYLQALIWAGLFLIIEMAYKTFIKAMCKVEKLTICTIYKRTIGILLIFASLLINSEWLIYSYILSTALGLIINMLLYCNLTRSSVALCFRRTASYAALPLSYYFASLIIYKISPNFIGGSIVFGLLFVYSIMLYKKLFK